ncbi:Major Facilitator Superfamily protein [Ehrlichia minasensis]|nr:Major Facilitator Superfamily protein [Ehrlichia minasensis]
MCFYPIFNWIIGVLVLVCGSNFQIAYSVIHPYVSEDLNLNIAQTALAASIHMWSFSVFQLFTGSVLDYCDAKKVLPISIVITAIGTFLFSYSDYTICFFISQVFLGLGASFGFVGAGYISYKFFSPLKSGIMFGLVQTVYSLSSLLMEYTYTYLTSSGLAWRDIIRYIEYAEIVVLILTLFLGNGKKSICLENNSLSISKVLLQVFKHIVEVIRVKNIWLFTIVGSLMFGVFLSIAILWGQKLLIAMNLSSHYSGVIHSIIWIGFAIGCPLVNKISNALKNRKYVFMGFSLLQCVSLTLLLYSHNVYLLCFLIFIFGCASGGHMLNFSISTDVVDESKVGTVCSIINGLMCIVGGVIMFLVGLALEYQDKYDIVHISLFMPILIFLSFGVLFFCRDTFSMK